MLEKLSEHQISDQSPKTLEELLERVRSYLPDRELGIIEKAYEFSEHHHRGQIRRSGEPYISHPLGVAAILADLHLDLPTIATGLLHDTVEDTAATLDDVKREFGQTIAHLVDGVTKISQMSFRNTHEKQGENIRKMIIAMGKDVRVILVKLADRLHNMRTLKHMAPAKQVAIARETLDIYAPLASRLGISFLKIELEDLSFKYMQPDAYYSLVQKALGNRKSQEKYIEDVAHVLQKEISARTRFKFDVHGRPKHFYSIWRKMIAGGLEYEQIFDILAFRVIVNSVSECYEVLGIVHSLWKPVPGRFKDFIAMPKTNNYQSLHTTVIGPLAERIEIQIRTQEMHLIAERGIAAHWKYKEGGEIDQSTSEKIHWLRDLVSLHQQTKNTDEFLENVKTDLFEGEIYVFTPKGDVKELPEGATPLDFAFSVHTDVGLKTVAARVNGKMVPLKTPLKSGDTVEVMTSKNQVPTKDWLKYCITSRAKSKIRSFIKNEQRLRALAFGQELLEKAFRKVGHSLSRAVETPVLPDFLKQNGTHSLEELYILVGYGRLTPTQVIGGLLPEARHEPPPKEEETFLQKAFKAAIGKNRKSSSLVQVQGLDDMLIHFAKCCNPIPGDPIVGFISRGRGVVIHQAVCPKGFEQDQDRRIDVEWTKDKETAVERVVRVRVISQDIPGLLKLMSEAFSARGMNIQNAQIRTTRDKKGVCVFDVSVRDTEQLKSVMSDLQKIKGIIGVTRLTRA